MTANLPPQPYLQPTNYVPPPAGYQPAPRRKPHGCLGAFLGFCLAVSFLATFGFLTWRATLLSPQFWKNWLTCSQVCEKIPEVFIPALFSSFTSDTGNQGVKAGAENTTTFLSPEAIDKLGKAFQQVVTPSWLHSQGEMAIDKIFRWLRGDDSHLQLAFDLRPLREPLQEAWREVMRSQFESLPVCRATQLKAKTAAEMICRPSGMTWEQAEKDFFSESEGINFADLPDEYVVDESALKPVLEQGSASQAGIARWALDTISNPPQAYRLFVTCLIISVVVTIAFSALLWLVYRRALAAGLRAIAIAFLVPAALEAGLSGVLYFSLSTLVARSSLWSAAFSSPSGDSPSPVLQQQTKLWQEFAVPVVTEWFRGVLGWTLILSLVFLAGAIALLIIGRVLRRRENPQSFPQAS